MTPVSGAFVAALRAALGEAAVVVDPLDLEPFLAERRGLYRGTASVAVRPASTADVAKAVSLCAAHGISIVPQGGNTGLVGGAVAGENQVILSLSRLNAIRALDPENFAMTVEAGCILEDLHRAAERVDRLFPLSLGAQGSCQIGGNLAANAGGLNFLAYGGARDLCLGLEVVLADGSIWNGLSALRKDNSGYALKHLFIGGEGTLGVVTAAVLKLFPRPAQKQTALCAVNDVAAVPRLLTRTRILSGDAATAFELMGRTAFSFALRHLEGVVNPFPHGDVPPWLVLLELSTARPGNDLRDIFESLLGAALEEGLIADAVVAESSVQEQMFHRLREGIPEAQKREGGSIKHDVSVPVSKIPELLRRGIAAVEKAMPGIRPCPFGHVGDGNIHFNLSQPEGMETAAFLEHWDEMNRIVHDVVVDLGGSFAAEHGIGRLKIAEFERLKPALDRAMMQAVKQALDPANLLNPGVVVDPRPQRPETGPQGDDGGQS